MALDTGIAPSELLDCDPDVFLALLEILEKRRKAAERQAKQQARRRRRR